MKKIFYLLSTVLFFTLLFTSHSRKSFFALAVSESDCLNKPASSLTSGELSECSGILESIAKSLAPAHEANKQELANLNSQVSSLQKRITEISGQLDSLEGDIYEREVDLGIAQVGYDQAAVTEYKLYRFWDLTVPLGAQDFSEAIKKANSIRQAIEELRETMGFYAGDLAKLREDKENLENI